MKIFLTGGTGFIGKEFIAQASNKGFFIFAVSRKNVKKKIKNVKWLKGEIDKDWDKYLSKVDVVVHLASLGVISKKKKDYMKILNFNVFKSLYFVLNAIKSGCRKFVIASSSSEYLNNGDSQKYKLNVNSKRKYSSAYSLSKIIFTDILKIISKKTFCKFRIMRIFPTYGEGEHISRLYPRVKKSAQNNKNFYVKNPNEFRDFTKVKYVAKTLLDACEFKKNEKFEIFHVSSGNTMNVKQFVKQIWKKYKSKGKLTFNNNSKIFRRHISSKNSIWKINS